MLRSIRKWLSVQWAKNAHLLILLGIIVFNVLLWLIASLASYLLDEGDFPNYGSALAQSIAWLLDPGTYNATTPFAVRLVSVIVIITAMVTFSGGIIAYVASVFSTLIENSKKGQNKLYLRDHVVILNWNAEAPELICDFAFRDEKADLVVLAEEDKEAMERQIKNKMFEKGRKNLNFNLIVRSGSVYSEAALDAVGILEAKTIIILRNEKTSGDEAEDADVLSLKALMMVLSSIKRKEETVIIEVASKKTVDIIKADKSHEGQVIAINAAELMGHLIAQTILIPKISEVYSEILSYEGVEFYPLEATSEEEAIKTYSSLVPVEENGRIFGLARGSKETRRRRKTPWTKERKLALKPPLRKERRRVVVFGKSSKRAYLEESIRLFALDTGEKAEVTFQENGDPNLILSTIENLQKSDVILILSDDSLPEAQIDSEVLYTLLLIKEAAKAKNVKVIVEILNQRHQEIAQKYDVENVIVSTTYLSHLITQLSENRDLFDLFEDLLTFDDEKSGEGSLEIYTYPVKDYVDGSFPLAFDSISEFVLSLYHASNGRALGIGLVHEGKVSLFQGDLDKNPLALNADDRLVVIDK